MGINLGKKQAKPNIFVEKPKVFRTPYIRRFNAVPHCQLKLENIILLWDIFSFHLKIDTFKKNPIFAVEFGY